MKKVLWLVLCCAAVAAAVWLAREKGPPAPESKGSPVLYGVNLDHWLCDEGRFGAERYQCDQPTVFESLRARFGEDEADRLLERYRSGFIGASDISAIRAQGFNAVRLPVSAALLYEKQGQTSRLARAAERIDWLLDQALTNGLAVVLNLRVRPGEWAGQPPVNGRRFPAVWSGRDVEEVARLWRTLAARFKDSPALVAYDLSPGPCPVEADWYEAFLAWLRAIRTEDPNRTVYAPWPRPALARFLADPQLAAMHPGFAADLLARGLDGPRGEAEVRRMLEEDMPRMDAYWKAAKMPCLASAYNPLAVHAGEPGWMAAYRQSFADQGWASMLSSYKVIDRVPAPEIRPAGVVRLGVASAFPDLMTSPPELLIGFFDAFGQPEAVPDADFQRARNTRGRGPAVREVAADPVDSGEPPEGWKLAQVGAVDGTVAAGANGALRVVSNGQGPGGFSSAYSFLYREVGHDFDLTAVLENVVSPAPGGAGLLVRANMEEKSPCLLIFRSPEGTVQAFADRADGQPALRRKLMDHAGPLYLRFIAVGEVLKASCSVDGSTWSVSEQFTMPWIRNGVLAGVVVFSGDEYRAAEAGFRSISLERTEATP